MEIKLDFDDVIVRPRRSVTASRSGVDILREFEFYHSSKVWYGFPIMAANMDTTGTFAMAKTLAEKQAITCLHKYYDIDDLDRFYHERDIDNYAYYDYVWYSMGITDDDIWKLNQFSKLTTNPQHDINICVDVANGYTDYFVKRVAKIRDLYPEAIIMAGNIATPDMAQELILGGADIVKVGIGPGSACTTRLVTGVGYPQFSAIQECAKQVHGLKMPNSKRLGLVCGDGGCKNPGDVCKAFAGNADFVMLGGMFAGCDECEGEWNYQGGQKLSYIKKDQQHLSMLEEGRHIAYGDHGSSVYATFEESKDNTWLVEPTKTSLRFYGMSSYAAHDKYSHKKPYSASEGRVIEVPYKGSALDVVKEIEGGIRSHCCYTGATSIKDMAKCAEFIRVNRVHDNMTWS